MKKILLLLSAAALLPFYGQATVRTVSNNPNSPGQYTDLTTAINAATPGDTLYVQGSNTTYGNITIKKRLTLIGAGHNPDKQFPLVSTVGYLYLDSLSTISGSSGTRIIGMSTGTVSITAVCHNVEFKRNYINGYFEVKGTNWLVENNIITNYVSFNNYANLSFRNNILMSYINTSNQPSVVITNNIFFGNSYGFSAVSNATVTNNIFFGRSPQGCASCQFNNNISYGTANNVFLYGTNIASGNLENVDPKFVNSTIGVYTFSSTSDYRLTAGSPGKNAGTDGTDIGVFGGNFPIPMGGEPRIPQIKSMNISNTVVPVNGTLNINVKAKKQD